MLMMIRLLTCLFIFLWCMAGKGMTWQDLWWRKDQQAMHLLQKGKNDEAAKTFESRPWRAVANYKSQKYREVEGDLKNENDPVSRYNLGNALALEGKYQEAIKAYNQAIKQQPSFKNAIYNRDLIKKLLERQNKQKPTDKNKSSNSNEKSQQPNKQDSKNGSENSSQNNEGQSKQPNKQQPSESGANQQNKQEKKDGLNQQDQQKKESEQDSQQKSQQKNNSGQNQEKNNSSNPQPNDDSRNNPSKKAEKKDQIDPGKAPEDNNNQASSSQQKEQKQSARLGSEQEDMQEQRKSKVTGRNEGSLQKNQQGIAGNRKRDQETTEWLQQIPDDPGDLLRRKIMRDHLRKMNPE